jgi:hypothetical protein
MNRLLYCFRATAAFPRRGNSYGGWEDAKAGLRGHLTGGWMQGLVGLDLRPAEARRWRAPGLKRRSVQRPASSIALWNLTQYR